MTSYSTTLPATWTAGGTWWPECVLDSHARRYHRLPYATGGCAVAMLGDTPKTLVDSIPLILPVLTIVLIKVPVQRGRFFST